MRDGGVGVGCHLLTQTALSTRWGSRKELDAYSNQQGWLGGSPSTVTIAVAGPARIVGEGRTSEPGQLPPEYYFPRP